MSERPTVSMAGLSAALMLMAAQPQPDVLTLRRRDMPPPPDLKQLAGPDSYRRERSRQNRQQNAAERRRHQMAKASRKRNRR